MKPEIEILADNDALARRVADELATEARRAIAERGRFTVALTGGDSPVPLYTMLAEDSAYRDFPWGKTLCFFGDERHVPPDDPDSNYRQAREKLFDTGLVPDENIFRFRAEMPDPEEAAADYEKTLRRHFSKEECLGDFPRFDLILLGLGANGHTASLFPCTDALHEKRRWAAANHVPELQKHRLTLTFPVLNAARQIFLESIDPRKKEIVEHVLVAEQKDFYPFPVQQVAPVKGSYRWFLTRETAPAFLQKSPSTSEHPKE
jgi:6-phosphogluconolactonase